MPNKTILYDFNNDYVINSTGAQENNILAKIAYQESPVWEVQAKNVNGSTLTSVDLSSATAWAAAINYKFNDTSTDPMCRSLNATIDSTLAYSGVIKVTLDANTSTFRSALINAENMQLGALGIRADGSLPVFFELRGYDNLGVVKFRFSFTVLAQGILDPAGGDPPEPIGNWYTKAEVDGIVGDKMQAPTSSTYGDLIAKGTTSTDWQSIHIGTEGQVLKVQSGYPVWGVASDTNAVHLNVANEISTLTEKTTLVNNDLFLIEDSQASGVKKKVKRSSLPSGTLTGATNAGSTGTGILDSTIDNVLQLRKINAASSKVSVTYNATSTTVDLDVNTGTTSTTVAVGNHTHIPSQVGLTNVTDDAQLKRSPNDWTSFPAKTNPDDNDRILLEDAVDSYNKKYILKSNLVSGGGGGSISDNSWTGSNFTSTSMGASQRVLQEAWKNIGVDTLASSLIADDNNKIIIANSSTEPKKYSLSSIKVTDVVNSLTQAGTVGIDIASKLGNTLTTKKIKAGTNVTITESNNEITVASSSSSGSMEGYPAVSSFTDSNNLLITYIGGDTNVKLQLHMENSITDSSLYAKTASNTGVTFSNTIYKFGAYSAYFNGSAYLQYSDNSDFNFGSGNFTIRTFVNFSTLNDFQTIFSTSWEMGKRGFSIMKDSSNAIRVAYSTDGTNTNEPTFAWTPSINTWYYLVVVRSGADLKVYINNSQIGSTYNIGSSSIYYNAYGARIGRNGGNATEYLSAFIDEFQVQKAAISDFSIPVSPFADIMKSVAVSSVKISDIVLRQTCNGRLTLESGVAVSTTDQTAKTTMYFTPYNGNQIALYDGTAWSIYSFAERSLSLAGLAANTNYDIFIYNNSGTLILESVAWTNDTTRATALTMQDGVYVKSGATTRRYLGTIRTTAVTGQCEDSQPKRFVWNLYNQVERILKKHETTASWTYASATIRQLRGDASNKIEFVLGMTSKPKVTCAYLIQGAAEVSMGLDSLTVFTVDEGWFGSTSSTFFGMGGRLERDISAGYHYVAGLEKALSGTPTIYGDVGSGWSTQTCGLTGTIKN